MNSYKKPGQVFKGYPLLDFVNPWGFSLDHVLRTTSLKAALEQHIKGFSVSGDAPETGGGSGRRGVGASVAHPFADTLGIDGHTSESFEQQLKDFLDGLYLGCFSSSVVQTEPRRPPQSYIYDIGFNTDKPTGFIVANPFDTLVTFGPRGRHVPYGVADPGVFGLPTFSNIKVTAVPSANTRDSIGLKVPHNNAFVTTFGTVDGKPDSTNNPPRASIICDLNIRIVHNQKQELQQLSFYGDTLKVHLSKGLVQPVVRSADRWVGTGRRLGFDVGTRVITLRRNRLPTWGGPIDLGGAVVAITSSNVFGRLHRIDIGGTPAKPLIVFEDVEILK